MSGTRRRATPEEVREFHRLAARDLLLLCDRCPSLFKRVWPMPDDVRQALHDILVGDDERDW